MSQSDDEGGAITCAECRGTGRFCRIACPSCDGRGYSMINPGKPSKRRLDKPSTKLKPRTPSASK